MAKLGRRMRLTRRRASCLLIGAMLVFGAVWIGSAARSAIYAAEAGAPRSVEGRVIDAKDAPIRSAIVYLSDTRSLGVESYITQEDGAYRFEQISPNDDYKLWAQADGVKSKIKILSSFDDRNVFHVILKIEADKHAAQP